MAMNARPSDRLAIAVAQLNSTVGDIAGNAEKVRRARTAAAAQGAELVVFPELFIAGYPPEDLVLKPAFQAACRATVEALARETASAGPALLVGSTAARSRRCASRSICRITACSTRSVYSRPGRCRGR
jgi:NAD+ synthase